MNKKGQTINLGVIIMVAITVIVGVIFLQTIAQSVGDTTNTISLVNGSYTAAADGEVFYITDYKYISGVSVLNGTTGEAIAAGNYTVANNVVYNGAEAIQITVDDAEFESETWFISGTVQPLTYIGESGGRAMASLVVIMFALAVLGVAIYPVIKEAGNWK